MRGLAPVIGAVGEAGPQPSFLQNPFQLFFTMLSFLKVEGQQTCARKILLTHRNGTCGEDHGIPRVPASNITSELFNCCRLSGEAWRAIVDKVAASDGKDVGLAVEAGLAAAGEFNHVAFPLLKVVGIFDR